VITDTSEIPVNLPQPLGAYKSVVLRGSLGFVSGQFPIGAAPALKGRVPDRLSLACAREAARIAALNVLGQIHKAVPGGLAAIRLARVDGYIACAPGFQQLAHVLDGASEAFVAILGERGLHARSVAPVTHLPNDMPLELVVTFEYQPTPQKES
jgi:enamine deaminase RidA (YjgF/YER057c/UK114 family)